MSGQRLPRTRRGTLRRYSDGYGRIMVAWPEEMPTPNGTPVLVIPEAAVKGCKHEHQVILTQGEWCEDCGSLRWYGDAVSHSRKPRILRAQP